MYTPTKYQKDSVDRLQNGNILVGDVGSGKTFTALLYFYDKICGGDAVGGIPPNKPHDLYVITTANKRDKLDWQREASMFYLSEDRNINVSGMKIVVDSWNNIKNYSKIAGPNTFFIFDEQRAVGTGTWAKTFVKIAKKTKWIMLSATPGDNWMQYVPVFLANGFFRNRTHFNSEHVVFKPFKNYPQIDRYVYTAKLKKLRDKITVIMDYTPKANRRLIFEKLDYDADLYNRTAKTKWNPFTDSPVRDSAELTRTLRKIVNIDPSRLIYLNNLAKRRNKIIVFYNFDYELELLKDPAIYYGHTVAEYNGHAHDSIPVSEKWVYLVQYLAGAEAWECIETDTMVFFSQSYSYRITEQAMGRIDRRNTPFLELFYLFLISEANVEKAIKRARDKKETFNESLYGSQDLHML